MITLKDTVSKMLSSDWKERLVSEIEQCDIRLYNLEKHMVKIGEESPEYSLLEAQAKSMREYLKTLTARAASFDVKYSLPSLDERTKDIQCLFSNENISDRDFLWMFILLYLMSSGGDSK